MKHGSVERVNKSAGYFFAGLFLGSGNLRVKAKLQRVYKFNKADTRVN